MYEKTHDFSASGKQYVTFFQAPTHPIHDLLASGQRVRHFLATAKGYTTFHPGAKGYATFWFKAFPVQGRRAKRPQKLPSSELEPEVVSVPCPRYPMRPEGPMGPEGPHGDWGGGGCAEGAPLRDISSLHRYISLTPIGAPPAGAHRTHKPNRNINEEQ